MNPIISAENLLKIKNKVTIFDVGNGNLALENYNKIHLENAIFIDVNTHLSDIKEDKSNGGRHPLPTVENFKKTLQSFGINYNDHLVLYDVNFGANAAARFWWMLRSIGHEKVQILDGGFQEASKIGFPMSNTINQNTEKVTEINQYHDNWQYPLITIKDVEKYSNSQEKLIIDVRESGRYNGDFEPIDLVAGHIPNAINIPFQNNLDENGTFLSPEILKVFYQKYFDKFESNNCIIHCGSGVTACHTILALEYAGFKTPLLYVGSWSEWSRNF